MREVRRLTAAALLLAAAAAVPGLAGCKRQVPGEAAGAATDAAEPAAEPAGETAAPHAPSEPRRIPIEVAYGETAEHSLAGGECHVLELDLEADRYVELEIEQLGIDVATELIPPGGAETVRFDAPVGGFSPERGSFVSEPGGVHRIEICPGDETADPGSYRLSIGRPEPSPARRRILADGFRAYSRAARQTATGDMARARTNFTRALERFREAGARSEEGWTLYKLGWLAQRTGEPDAAERRFAQAAAIHAEVGDVRQEAFVLNELGQLLHGQGRRVNARDVQRRALDGAERAGESGLLLNALANLAYSLEELGYTLEAIELQQRRERLARKAGDAESEWEALTQVAEIYLYSGRLEEAFPRFDEALELTRNRGLEGKVVESFGNLGKAYLEGEEPERALGYFERALEGSQPQFDAEVVAKILNNLGRCYRRLGEREKALGAFEEGLSMAPEGSFLEALLHINLATIYVEEADFETPATHCRRAYTILRDYERPGFLTGPFRCLARIDRAHGELRSAAEYARKAVELVETYRTRSALGELRAHFLADQYAYYELYADVLLRLEERHPGEGYAQRAFQVAELSKGRTLLDNLRQAEAEIRRRADPGLTAQESELQERMSALERRLLRERFRGGPDRTVAVVEERLRALREEHALVVGRILAESPGWSALLRSEPATLEEIRSELLADGESQLVSFLLGEERSYAWVVGRDSLDVAILPARRRIEDLGRQVARLLAGGNQPHLRLQMKLASARLSEELLEPLAPNLSARKLLLVKDGVLHYVPFAALPLPGGEGDPEGRPVVDRFELVEMPSASAAVALSRRHADRPAPLREVAILADPVFEPSDERLRTGGSPTTTQAQTSGISPAELSRRVRSARLGELTRLAGSAEETRFISSLVREEDLLVATGFDASRDLLLHGGLEDFRILHLGGHGLAHAELTGLVLSLYDERGRLVDGLVQPYEIYGLRLSADLVVLSACRTGLGQEIRGEGLMGLSRGFLHAGASQVLASLWDVDDAATAELMRRFYTAHLLEGKPPAEALWAAQRSLRRSREWSAPHFWAGFVLQGAGV